MCVDRLSRSPYVQQIDVKGHVKDATGEDVIGATVRVDGTNNGTVTGINGNFNTSTITAARFTVTTDDIWSTPDNSETF